MYASNGVFKAEFGEWLSLIFLTNYLGKVITKGMTFEEVTRGVNAFLVCRIVCGSNLWVWYGD